MEKINKVFSRDVTLPMIISVPNKEMVAMLVFQSSPVGVELFSYSTTLLFFYSSSILLLIFLFESPTRLVPQTI